MPLIKEVFFKNKRKEIAFLNKKEMLDKVDSFLLKNEKYDYEKRQREIIKNLKWFQKINFGEKEFFVEKSDNPLKIKDELIEKENSTDTVGIIAFVSLFPVGMIPVGFYLLAKNYMNKIKSKKNKNVYIKNTTDSIGFHIMFFLLINIAAGVFLTMEKLWIFYLFLFGLNFLIGMLKINTPYLNVENYELVNFRLEEEFDESDSVETKIKKMKAKELVIENKKHELDFLNELDFSQGKNSNAFKKNK